MKIMEQEIINLLSPAVSPVRLAFYHSAGDYDEFHPIYRLNLDAEVADKAKSIYEIPALLRTLGIRHGIFSQDLITELYNDASDILCCILEWTNHSRKIALIHLKDLDKMDETNLGNILQNSKESLHDLCQISFHRWQQRTIP